jgi:predicted ArsR family transcriptional regulator
MENIQDVTVSIGEAAKELGVSVDTVRTHIERQKDIGLLTGLLRMRD